MDDTVNKPAVKLPKTLMPNDNTSEIIAQTVEKTLAQILPLLQRQEKPAVVQQELNSANVRSEIIRQINRDFDRVLNSNKQFMAKLAAAPANEFIQVRIPRVYAQYFGPMLPVGVNGSIINVPIDNRYHKVHKIYGPIIQQTLEYEDEKISFMQRSERVDIREVTQSTLGQ